MNFLDPEEWNDVEALEKEYQDLDEELIKNLHNKLRPYFLRRVKSEVLELPPKACDLFISSSDSNIDYPLRTKLSSLSQWLHCNARCIGLF